MTTTEQAGTSKKLIGIKIAHSINIDIFNKQVNELLKDGFKPSDLVPLGIYNIGPEVHFCQIMFKHATDLSLNPSVNVLGDYVIAAELVALPNAQDFNARTEALFNDNYIAIEKPRPLINEESKQLTFTVHMVKLNAFAANLTGHGSPGVN